LTNKWWVTLASLLGSLGISLVYILIFVGWLPYISVADPYPGSGAFLTRIPNPYFLELSDKFFGKKFYNYLKTGPNFFLRHFKNKIIFNFLNFVATKKGMTTNFFSPFSFLEVFGSRIRNG
jgi:hypothetical protein